jgi:hypothetical protein
LDDDKIIEDTFDDAFEIIRDGKFRVRKNNALLADIARERRLNQLKQESRYRHDVNRFADQVRKVA